MNRRLIAALILSLSILAGCGRAQVTQAASTGYRLFLQEGYANGAQFVNVIDSGTGRMEQQLPLGTPAPDWSRYYTIRQGSDPHQLRALDPASGRILNQVAIPDTFELPNLNGIGPTAGLSPNGRWIALVSQGPDQGGQPVTAFMVGASSLTESFATVHLNGNFAFDALSNDGNRLYVIQHLGNPNQNHYQVRLYDLAAGTLVAQPIVDKREPNEPMNGIRGDSAADVTGNHVYTVYIRDGGPFIHALPLDEPIAWCVDLPSKAPNDLEMQFRWSLAISSDGRTVYAVNASLGTVGAMSTSGEPPQIGRVGQLALNRAGNVFGGLIQDAEAKGPRIGGAALSSDGRTLFALGDTGVLAIDTASLKVRLRLLDGQRVDSLRMSSDGKWLYAAVGENSKLWQVDPASGAVRGEVKGVTNPWALLWAAPVA
jgi:hypothetical protein